MNQSDLEHVRGISFLKSQGALSVVGALSVRGILSPWGVMRAGNVLAGTIAAGLRIYEILDGLGNDTEPCVERGFILFPPPPELRVLHANHLLGALVRIGHDFADSSLVVLPQNERRQGVNFL